MRLKYRDVILLDLCPLNVMFFSELASWLRKRFSECCENGVSLGLVLENQQESKMGPGRGLESGRRAMVAKL